MSLCTDEALSAEAASDLSFFFFKKKDQIQEIPLSIISASESETLRMYSIFVTEETVRL